jgi:hypothetical protein
MPQRYYPKPCLDGLRKSKKNNGGEAGFETSLEHRRYSNLLHVQSYDLKTTEITFNAIPLPLNFNE